MGLIQVGLLGFEATARSLLKLCVIQTCYLHQEIDKSLIASYGSDGSDWSYFRPALEVWSKVS